MSDTTPGLVQFETPRLRLRRLVDDHAPFILALLNEPSWLRYIGDRGVHSLEDARRYITDGPQKMYEQHGFGLWLVERKHDGAPLGLCGLLKRDTLPDADIGFALSPPFWSDGYAYEAAAATLGYGREVLGLDRVVAITKPDNVASARLLERLGLRDEGFVRLRGSDEDLRLFGTTPAYELDAENVRRVYDWLWTSGQLSAADIDKLPGLGIEAVVNLALPTSSNALPGEAERVTRLGLPYVHIPVPWESPDLRHARQFFGVMDALAGRKVWVHCAKNMRVSAFVYLYRRLKRGESHSQALQPMRSIWEPDPTWRAFIASVLDASEA